MNKINHQILCILQNDTRPIRYIIYRCKTVRYGFKNSLSAFIMALEKVLGNDEINNNLVMYVDGLLVHSSTFSEHQQHIDAVLHKLTTAGFTVNAVKCNSAHPKLSLSAILYLTRQLGPTKNGLRLF